MVKYSHMGKPVPYKAC